ncbi:DUF6976 family protein [Maridesulfovibrio bastinii]|uniref:DUF6976 family protein n=1 Tax=Maridesulfovibrio bastinii TaxID=47157 RepID=UPI00041AF666|nr:hypothetical protein [Maridesulfovibrio bastinii]
MNNNLLTKSETENLINSDRILLLSGDEDNLKSLPKGNWIGGTTPYFVSKESGGLISKDKIFVSDITSVAKSIMVKNYDEYKLRKLYGNSYPNGFNFIIIPSSSPAHSSFALNAPSYKKFGKYPLLGWISGVHINDLGKIKPKIFNGITGESFEDEAIVMHVEVDENKTIEIGTVNNFEQGDGDILTFMDDGFSCKEVMVNGLRESFGDYIIRNGLDTKLPLVANYFGKLVNISFQSFEAGGTVRFYAPVFTGVRYKHAKPVGDYAQEFNRQMQNVDLNNKKILFSCNCVLNYMHLNLEGKKTEPFTGPFTFGEIAYQLLNQTLVYLSITES